MPELRITIRRDLISTTRAARIAGMARPSIVTRIMDGRLAAEQIEGQWFVRRAEIEQLAAERLATTAPAAVAATA